MVSQGRPGMRASITTTPAARTAAQITRPRTRRATTAPGLSAGPSAGVGGAGGAGKRACNHAGPAISLRGRRPCCLVCVSMSDHQLRTYTGGSAAAAAARGFLGGLPLSGIGQQDDEVAQGRGAVGNVG